MYAAGVNSSTSGAAATARPQPTLAKIVATVGPASRDPATLRRLVDAGVAVFRLNLSHGTLEDHARSVGAIRAVARSASLPIAILGDLPGPKIRLGNAPEAGVPLYVGYQVLIDPLFEGSGCCLNGVGRFGCTYKHLSADVKPGHRVLISDGTIRLRAIDRAPGDPASSVRCILEAGPPERGGEGEGGTPPAVLIRARKGVNLPDSNLSELGAMTARDWELAQWCVGEGVDMLALSFVRSAGDVAALQDALRGMTSARFEQDHGEPAETPVIAKIETPQAVADLESIVRQADGIMVARGDLGVEMDLWDVPIIQRRLIEQAGAWGKPCIVATQMLESMITSPVPTRAEVGDVATAVLDHADAVMLSGETAAGAYPVEAVEYMRRTIAAAEAYSAARVTAPTPPARLIAAQHRIVALAHGAWHIARDVQARLVVCWSQTGGLARCLAQTGFSIPIVAYSSSPRHTRRMALYRGVRPLVGTVPDNPTESLALWNDAVDAELIARGWAKAGDPVVLIAGRPLGAPHVAGTVAVHYVGNPGTGFRAHS